jgi:hypothetical protein
MIIEASRLRGSAAFEPVPMPTPSVFGLGGGAVPNAISVRGSFGHGTADFVRLSSDTITYAMTSRAGAAPNTTERANMFAMILMQTYFPGERVPPGEIGDRAAELCRDPSVYAAYQRFMRAPEGTAVELALSQSPSLPGRGATALV